MLFFASKCCIQFLYIQDDETLPTDSELISRFKISQDLCIVEDSGKLKIQFLKLVSDCPADAVYVMRREPTDENLTSAQVGVNDLANISQRIHSSNMQSPPQDFGTNKSTGISSSGHSPQMYDVLVHFHFRCLNPYSKTHSDTSLSPSGTTLRPFEPYPVSDQDIIIACVVQFSWHGL
jgi:hypothetical protein